MSIKGCCGGNETSSDLLKENKLGCITEKRRSSDYVLSPLYTVDFPFASHCYNSLRPLQISFTRKTQFL